MIQAKKVLVLAPHTDDGELGCGGTISKFISAGSTVHIAAFSICSRSLPPNLAPRTLEYEAKEAAKIFGLPAENLVLFDYDVRNFQSNRQPILEDLVKLNKTIQPDLVLLPCTNDIHQDHQVIAQEGFRAFKNTTVLGYELPWNTPSFNSACFIRLDEVQLNKKMEALKAYQSQKHRNYMGADFIKGWAQTRGVQAGSTYAEAFEVLRWII